MRELFEKNASNTIQLPALGTLIFSHRKDEVCLPDLAVLQREEAVQEHKEADQRCRKQHPRVPAEPGEVQTDLLSEVPPATAAEHRRREFEAF